MVIASYGWKSVFAGNRPRSCQALSQFVLHLGRSFPAHRRAFRKIFALAASALCSPLRDLKTAEVDLSPLNTGERSAVTTEWTLLVECARPTGNVERLNKSLRLLVNWPALLELAEG